MKREYAIFYAEGREDRLLRTDIDTDQIAEEVLDGKGTIHELTKKAVLAAAEPLKVGRKKRHWIDAHKDDIAQAGGDEGAAYEHFVEGKIDELVLSLEEEVASDICAVVGEEEEGEEGEEDDEDEGDEDEHEDGEDDDENETEGE